MALNSGFKDFRSTPDGEVMVGSTPFYTRNGKIIGLNWAALKERRQERYLREEKMLREGTLRGPKRLKRREEAPKAEKRFRKR